MPLDSSRTARKLPGRGPADRTSPASPSLSGLNPLFSHLTRWILYTVLGTVPVLFAAVDPWVWSGYTAAVFAVFLILLWQGMPPLQGLQNKLFFLTAGLFFLFTLFQTVPLPAPILAELSPFRGRVLENARDILGVPGGWAPLSYRPLESLARWIFYMGLILLFQMVTVHAGSREGLNRVVLVLIGIGTLEAVYGLVQVLVPSLGVLWEDTAAAYFNNARGTYINRNHFAGCMEMLWPVALGYTMALSSRQGAAEHPGVKNRLASERTQSQVLLCILISVMVLSLIFSRSRGGITGGLIGFLAFWVLMRVGTGRISTSFSVFGTALVGLVLLYGARIGFGPIIQRFLLISEGNSRLDAWRDSLKILRDHPLGVGLFNFKEVFPVYYASITSEQLRMSHTHNDYLQFLIEAGWPGGLLLIGGFFTFLAKGFGKTAQFPSRQDPLRLFVGIGALSGLVSMAFHSFFDFNLQIPANTVYFVTLTALAYACLWQGPGQPPNSRSPKN